MPAASGLPAARLAPLLVSGVGGNGTVLRFGVGGMVPWEERHSLYVPVPGHVQTRLSVLLCLVHEEGSVDLSGS